jgi:hypothetical protein
MINQSRGLKLTTYYSELDITSFRNINRLEIIDMRLHQHQDLTEFQGVRNLNLEEDNSITSCEGLINGLTSLMIMNFTKLEDSSQLSSISTLSTVEFVGCDSLSDISGLRNVKKLTMICEGKQPLINLSSLTEVETLFLVFYQINTEELKYCKQLQSLTLSDCRTVTESSFQNLTSLRKVNLSNCQGITDISMLSHCSWIAIRNCPIRNLNGLENVKSIIIEACSMQSLNGLGKNNQYLSIPKMEIVDLSSLKNIHTVKMDKIGDGETISMKQLSNVQRLLLIDIKINHLASLKAIQLLILEGCKGFSKLPKILSSVPSLHLLLCFDLKDISEIGNNQQVIIDNCCRISDVSSLRNVKDVRIHDCYAVKNYSSLINVQRLEIYFWQGISVNEEVNQMNENKKIILNKTPFDYEKIFPVAFEDLAEY